MATSLPGLSLCLITLMLFITTLNLQGAQNQATQHMRLKKVLKINGFIPETVHTKDVKTTKTQGAKTLNAQDPAVSSIGLARKNFPSLTMSGNRRST